MGNAQSGSQRFYLGNVSQPIILAQAWRAPLLDLVEPQNFGRRLADKLMLLKTTCFPDLLRDISQDTFHCWIANSLEFL